MSDVPWGAIAQAGGSIVQGISNGVATKQYSDAANSNEDLMRDAYKRALEMLQSGELNYNPAQIAGLGPGAMESVVGDAAAELAQKEALSRLGEASRSGFDTIDRAAINKTMGLANANERGQREAALARLDPNSGAAMAARMGAQQSGANRANQSALDIAAMSRQRALGALGQYGGLATNMRNQGFNENAQRAQAHDAISRFNSEVSRFNAGSQNQAMQNGINNKLNAQSLVNGATGAYGNSMLGAGVARAQNTATVGQGVGNGLNALGELNGKSQGNGSGQAGANGVAGAGAGGVNGMNLEGYGDELTPDEEMYLNEEDDE